MVWIIGVFWNARNGTRMNGMLGMIWVLIAPTINFETSLSPMVEVHSRLVAALQLYL